jgi:hypothetical protein
LKTGIVKIKKLIKAPWKSYFYAEIFDRSKWHRAMVDRHVPDFCAGLMHQNEPWYPLTSQFSQQCPYEAGFVQVFDNIDFQKLTVLPPYFTRTLIGKYRATFFSELKDENGTTQTDCLRIGFEIAEV